MKGAAYLSAAGAAIFLALAAYGAASGMELADAPVTVTAEYVSVSDSICAEGKIIREEEYTDCGFFAKLCVPDGKRVACGSVIAKRGKTEILSPKAGFFSSDTGERGVVKIVYGLKWQYETDLGSVDCNKFSIGDKATLRTPYGDFAAVTTSKRGTLTRFTVKGGVEKVLCTDSMEAELIYGEKSGFRVPESAVCHDDKGDYVTVLTGGMTVRAAVSECFRSDGYCLVNGDIKQGMEILVKS